MTATKKSKPGKDVIYVDPDDEITAIIDKVEAAKQKIVALVLPKRFSTLQSTVNMRLLKRTSDKSSKNVVLITSEAALLPLAGATGLHVAKNLQSKPEVPPSPLDAKETLAAAEDLDESLTDGAKLDHHRSIGELAAAHADDEDSLPLGDEEDETPAAPPKKTKTGKFKIPDFDRFRLRLALGALGLVGLIVFLIFATKVLPKASITLKTSSTPVSTDFNFTASQEAEGLNESGKIVPSELKKADQTANAQIQASGERNDGKKASGEVTMTAQRCSPNIGTPSNVSAGTGVSSGGNVYITQDTASFSISSTTPTCVNYESNGIDVVAQNAGADYNVNNANFSVAGRSDVSASGSASGGTDKIVKILSQQDVENTKKQITQEESDEYSKKFVQGLKDQGFYVVEPTLKLSEPAVATSTKVGQEATTVEATVKITYSVLVLPNEDLQKLVTNALVEQIDKNKQELSDQDVLKNATVTVINQDSSADSTLNVSVESTAIPKIDQAAIKSQVGGKKDGDIRNLLSTWPGVQDVEVKMSPFWVSKAPGNPGKITIVLEQVKEDNPPENGN